MNEYCGSLSFRDQNLDPIIVKAYQTYKNQLSRCNNKKIRGYRDYGAKGIRVEYTARQFVYWYLKNINTKFKDPVVGRIDHSKNYSLNNIEIQERSSNSSEAMQRTSHRFSSPVIVRNKKTNKIIDKCKSMKHASIKYGCSMSSVWRYCFDKVKNKKLNYIFSLEVGHSLHNM